MNSLPNGEEQVPHRDFPSFETGRAKSIYKSIQGGLIIGLMPDTKLIVYKLGPNEVIPANKKMITFGKGDCVLFRGDLIHAGAAYEELNYRIHAAITVKGIDWNEDATEAAPVVQFKCNYCPFMADTRKRVNNHKANCKDNPNYKAIQERKAKYYATQTTCEKCGEVFKSTQAYYRHFSIIHGGKRKNKQESQ